MVKGIFVIIVSLWFFFGTSLYFMFIDNNLFLGIFILIFFICGIGLLLILSRTNFIEIFSYYKAQKKGKRYFGYIYEVTEPNKKNNVISDLSDAGKDLLLNNKQKDFFYILHDISGASILKIIIYDDIKMETVVIEKKISGFRIKENQYLCVYKYKNNYYIEFSTSCVIPKFVVPKNQRLEIKRKLNEMM